VYANGRRVELVVRAPGGLRQLSVGVLVPGVCDPVELAKLREVVALAAGMDRAGGDALAVYHVALSEGAASGASAESPFEVADTEDQANDDHAASRTAQDDSIDSRLVPWGLAVIAIVIVACVLLALRSRTAGARRLSDAEREQVLEDLSCWANGTR
jgi:flagellar M-ring protein FliF